jgi:hypothetical protein
MLIDFKISDYCSFDCNFCVPGDTLIEGNGIIEDIQKDDMVISYDHEKGFKVELPVIEKYERKYSGEMIRLEVDNKVLLLTPNHEIFTRNRGYIRADELTLDDEVLIN